MLFGEIQLAQRVADRLPDLCTTHMGPDETGNREAGLQFEPAPGDALSLRDAAELGQGCRLQEIGEAEARHRLDRPAAGGDNAFPIACRAVRDAKPDVMMTDAWVQWAQAQRPLRVFDPLFGSAVVAEDDCAPAEGVGRSSIDQQRAVDGVHRGVVIVCHEAYYKAGGSECLRIVGTTLDRGPRVAQRSLLI